jgi:hypothetical protein
MALLSIKQHFWRLANDGPSIFVDEDGRESLPAPVHVAAWRMSIERRTP